MVLGILLATNQLDFNCAKMVVLALLYQDLNTRRLLAPSNVEAAATMIDKMEGMNIPTANKLLGHMSEAATRAAAAAIGYHITRGTLGPCESCAIGNGRQANINESKEDPATSDKS
jgi:hypothetical protein